MNDNLGTRMKENYENRSRTYLPRRTYTVVRLDGKAFHTFTKPFKRPFDLDLIDMMDQTAKFLCSQVQGCKLAYIQSDEISLILTDFDSVKTNAWYDGNIQKITSVSSSFATSEFNKQYIKFLLKTKDGNISDIISNAKLAHFDSRTFTIPEKEEVINYLIWRQEDATKNSISALAQSLYSQKDLHGKNGNQQQEMIWQKGTNWNDLPVSHKRGRMIIRETIELKSSDQEDYKRNVWLVKNPPIFSSQTGKDQLKLIIP